MNGFITKEAAKLFICDWCILREEGCTNEADCSMTKAIASIPSADVVEVVRCRDCMYRDYDDEPYGKKIAVCTGAMAYSHTPDDWYCPMGKHKNGG